MGTLQETIREIAKRGWRVTFEGFGDGNVYFTITSHAAAKPFSHISKGVSRYELDFGKIDILAAKLEHAYQTLLRLEENPYGNPEREATETK